MDLIVERKIDKKLFISQERLGSGLLGIVYKGVGSDGEEIAIKVPSPRLDQAQLRNFHAEFEVLDKFQEKWNDKNPHQLPPVPLAYEGQDRQSGQDILLLEYVGAPSLQFHLGRDRLTSSSDSISDSLKTEKGFSPVNRELLALDAAIAYVEMLRVMHEIGYTSADRKTGDIRWAVDGEEKRLVVLDWNAIRQISESGVREDIKTFGLLWYQMMTGRYAAHANYLLNDPAYTVQNRRISLGALDILHKCIYPNAYNSFSKLEDLLQSLESWFAKIIEINTNPNEAYDRLTDDLQTLSDKNLNIGRSFSEILRGTSRRISLPDYQFFEEWGVLKGFDGLSLWFSDKYENASLLEQAQDLVASQGDRQVDRVSEFYSMGGFSFAEQEISQTQQSQSNEDNQLGMLEAANQMGMGKPELLLRISRWKILVSATKSFLSLVSSYKLSKDRAEIVNILKDFEQEALKTEFIENKWEQINNTIQRLESHYTQIRDPNPISNFFKQLEKEIEWHWLVDAWRMKSDLGDYSEALSNVKKLTTEISEAEQNSNLDIQNYLDALQNVKKFSNLDEEAQHLRKRLRSKRLVESIKRDVSQELKYATPYLLQRLEDVQRSQSFDENDLNIEQHKNLIEANRIIAEAQLDQNGRRWIESIQNLNLLFERNLANEEVKDDIDQLISNAIESAQEMTAWGWVDKPFDILTEVKKLQTKYESIF